MIGMPSEEAGEGTKEAGSSRLRSGQMLGLGVAFGLVLGLLAGDWNGPVERPESETSRLLEEAGLVERTAHWATVLSQAEPGDLERLRPRVDAFVPGPQDVELRLFAEWWARFDPEAAIAWADETERRTGLDLSLAVLREWGRQDPRTALARAEARFFARKRGQILDAALWMDKGTQAVLVGWDESLVPGAVEWVFERPDRRERQGLMAVLARARVARSTPSEIWSWAEGLPDPLRRDMLPLVASALASRHPEEAAERAQRLIEAGDDSGLAGRVAMRWAKRDPRAALAWLSALPESADRRDAITESARAWLSADQEAFFDYMESREAELPEWLEPAFGLHARGLARAGRFEEGLAVAVRLREPDLRTYTVTLVLRQWLQADRAQAEAWIEKAGIPDGIVRRARVRPGVGASLPSPSP